MIVLSLVVMGFILMSATLSLRTERGDALGTAPLAIGSFAFIYLIQSSILIYTADGKSLFTEWQLFKGILMPAMALSCYMLGWGHYRRRKLNVTPLQWSGSSLWKAGAFTSGLGLCLYVYFIGLSGGLSQSFSAAHGTAMNYENSSAYVYSAPWWINAGIAMMLCSRAKLKLSLWQSLFIVFCVLVCLAIAVVTGSRGPLFSIIMVVFASLGLVRKQPISIMKALVVISFAGAGAILMLGYRPVLHLGEHKSEVPSIASVINSLSGLNLEGNATTTSGNEFVYSTALIDTVDHTGKLTYGFDWIYFIILNPIPRAFWPSKQYPNDLGVTWSDIKAFTGITIASGAAPGIVADLYKHFGFSSFLFFYFWGRMMRRWFIAAQVNDSPGIRCSYVIAYAVILNGFTQDFRPQFVSFGYAVIPIALFVLFSSRVKRQFLLGKVANRLPLVRSQGPRMVGI